MLDTVRWREGGGDDVRGVRSVGDRPAHTHHRVLLQQLLRPGEEEGEDDPGESQTGGRSLGSQVAIK